MHVHVVHTYVIVHCTLYSEYSLMIIIQSLISQSSSGTNLRCFETSVSVDAYDCLMSLTYNIMSALANCIIGLAIWLQLQSDTLEGTHR